MRDYYLRSIVKSLSEGTVINDTGVRLDTGQTLPFYVGAIKVRIKTATAKVPFVILTGNNGADGYPTADAEVDQLLWDDECPFGAGDQDLNTIFIRFELPGVLVGTKNAGGKSNFLWGKTATPGATLTVVTFESIQIRE